MTALYQSENISFIDHRDHLSIIYIFGEKSINYTIRRKLFAIYSKVKGQKSNKRSHSSSDGIHEENFMLRQMYTDFKQNMSDKISKLVKGKYCIEDADNLRDLTKQLFESTVFDHNNINGGNNSDVPLKCNIKGDYFLIPQKCRFYCGCVKEQCSKLESEGVKFDVLLADPPWWNKYIRRLKGANEKLGYKMMYNEDIASIPVKPLFAENCLVAVWCTNAPSNINAVKDIIFPSWGVEYVTTWYWLKVTVDLEPVCDFSSGCKKQPYERLILGKVGELKSEPKTQMFVSIPSALHSHKPPVFDLLSPYTKAENPQTLELFARYLLPNTTSVGYEPLKWQHESLYETVS